MSEAKRRRSQQRQKEKQADVEAAVPLGKYLASTEKKIRDGAIKSLAKYLAQSDREPLSEADMAKLWKGIFYCFWMSDKPRVQQALAQELADLLLTIKVPSSSTSSPTKPALLFLQGFFDAMIREWPGLDKWRVDKFYLLFRRFLNAAFRLLAHYQWEEEGLSCFNASLLKQGGPLCANDIKVPDGITYHLADIYMEELDKAVHSIDKSEEESANFVPLLDLLRPFVKTLSTCHSSLVYDRILNAVVNPILEDCLVREIEAGDDEEISTTKRKANTQKSSSSKRQRQERADDSHDESDDVEGEDNFESACQFPSLMSNLGKAPEILRKEIFSVIFESASQTESIEARRRRLYRLCKDEEERLEEQQDGL